MRKLRVTAIAVVLAGGSALLGTPALRPRRPRSISAVKPDPTPLYTWWHRGQEYRADNEVIVSESRATDAS
jgi:hypothetical protein